MAGTEVMWDAEPDTIGSPMNAPIPQGAPSKTMTFLSNARSMVDGADKSDGRDILRGSSIIVLVSLGLLWVFGGVILKDVRL